MKNEILKEIKKFERMQIDLKSNLDRLQYKIDHESKVITQLYSFLLFSLPIFSFCFSISFIFFFLIYFRNITISSINFKSYKLNFTIYKTWMINIPRRLFGKDEKKIREIGGIIKMDGWRKCRVKLLQWAEENLKDLIPAHVLFTPPFGIYYFN